MIPINDYDYFGYKILKISCSTRLHIKMRLSSRLKLDSGLGDDQYLNVGSAGIPSSKVWDLFVLVRLDTITV